MLFIRSTTSPSQKSRTFTNFFVFSLHEIAADLAIQATSKFLNDIRSTVGDDIFAKFLNLKTERSRAFVIDVSGSMSGEPHFAHLIKVNSVILRFSWKPLNQKSGKPRFYQQGQLKPIFKKKMQLLNFIHFFPYLIASFFYFISLFFCLFFFFLIIIIFNFSPDEISEVKRKSIKFVQDSLKKNSGTSFTYILVPFSDPSMFTYYLINYIIQQS